MSIHCTPFDTAIVLTMTVARLDAAVAVSFKEDVRRCLQDNGKRVLIDMRRVEFLDSSGLGALVAVTKMLPPGVRLELAGCGSVVCKVLSLTRMDRVFVLHDHLPSGLHPGTRTAA